MSGHDTLMALGRVEGEVGATFGARGTLELGGMRSRIDDLTLFHRKIGLGGLEATNPIPAPWVSMDKGSLMAPRPAARRLQSTTGWGESHEKLYPDLYKYSKKYPYQSFSDAQKNQDLFDKSFRDIWQSPVSSEVQNEAYMRAWGKELAVAGELAAKVEGEEIGADYLGVLLSLKPSKINRTISVLRGGTGAKGYGNVAIVPHLGDELHAFEGGIAHEMIRHKGAGRTHIKPQEALYFVEEQALLSLPGGVRKNPLVHSMSVLEEMIESRQVPKAIRRSYATGPGQWDAMPKPNKLRPKGLGPYDFPAGRMRSLEQAEKGIAKVVDWIRGGNPVFHRASSSITVDALNVGPRIGKQSRKGRKYAGFYLSSTTKEHTHYGDKISKFLIDPKANIRVVEGTGVDRISASQYAKFREEGVDVLVGREMYHSTSIAVINKGILKDFRPGIRKSRPTSLGEFHTKPYRRIDGLRRGVNNKYSIGDDIKKNHIINPISGMPEWPAGRSSLFRQGMHKVLGLSDEYLAKSAIGSRDAVRLRDVSMGQLEEVGQEMARMSGLPLAISSKPTVWNRTMGEAASAFFSRPKLMPKFLMSFLLQKTGVPKSAAQGIAKSGEGVFLFHPGGRPTNIPMSPRQILMHELIEYSEIVKAKQSRKGIPKGLPFGSHMSPTVISEESRMARVFGDAELEAQRELRTKEHWHFLGNPEHHRYAESLKRMGQVSPGGNPYDEVSRLADDMVSQVTSKAWKELEKHVRASMLGGPHRLPPIRRIDGLRRGVNNKYSIGDDIKSHPDYDFLAGRIALSVGENIGQGLSRIGQYLEETLGLKSLGFKDLPEGVGGQWYGSRASAQDLGAAGLGQPGHIRLSRSLERHLSERFDPGIKGHLNIAALIRHDAGHAALDVGRELSGHFKEVERTLEKAGLLAESRALGNKESMEAAISRTRSSLGMSVHPGAAQSLMDLSRSFSAEFGAARGPLKKRIGIVANELGIDPKFSRDAFEEIFVETSAQAGLIKSYGFSRLSSEYKRAGLRGNLYGVSVKNLDQIKSRIFWGNVPGEPHRIVGVRPDGSELWPNPYAIGRDIKLHPEIKNAISGTPQWPGGAIRLHPGKNIGQELSRIGQYLDETIGLRALAVEGSKMPSAARGVEPGTLAHYDPYAHEILIGGEQQHLLKEAFDPSIGAHIVLASMIRHEAGHSALSVGNELRTTYDELTRGIGTGSERRKFGHEEALQGAVRRLSSEARRIKVHPDATEGLIDLSRRFSTLFGNPAKGIPGAVPYFEKESQRILAAAEFPGIERYNQAMEEVFVEASAGAGVTGSYGTALAVAWKNSAVEGRLGYGLSQKAISKLPEGIFFGHVPLSDLTPSRYNQWSAIRSSDSLLVNHTMKRRGPREPGSDFPKGRLDSVLQAAKPYKGWGILAGTVAALWAAYEGLSWLFGEDEETYLSASALGKRGEGLERSLFDETEQFDARTQATLRGGTYFGEIIAAEYGVEGAEAEVKVIDSSLGVKGYIDVLLPGNIPVEVKTISSTGFDRLGRPLEAHTSQLNFYLHAREAQFGYILYLDGQDISRRKSFRVGYQPGRLIADVEEARSTILSSPSRMTNDNISWLQQTYQMDPSYLRGMRHSSGYASSFDSIKPSSEFPGGRISSVLQASKYRKLGSPDHIPTMGLTIRKHQTAIGHRSRGGRAKRVGGRTHSNGSRTYR